ncbi:esterase 1 [Phellopilus nigrolimitatus]|nr:esterase 1 [Phellopilus nigrolimitatus]
MPLVAYALVSILLTLARFAASLPVVQLGNTTLLGAAFPELQQEFFGGIPFAEPPIGNLRFAPPVAKLNPGVAELNASQFGAACSQLGSNASAPDVSEDCLTINVFRPASLNLTTGNGIPVMAWVYGGGFLDGFASTFNASAIVLQSIERGTPIIYVNFNYRLGPLGFPQGTEAEQRGALNLGNKDVLAALQWVRENIGAFGGDKEKVTVFGESAGSIIISQLLLDPNFNLARAAILESGSVATAPLFNASRRDPDWQLFASVVPECADAAVGDTFDCLRSASFETIVNASNVALSLIQEEFPFLPVIDGPGGIIPDLPSKLFPNGEFAHIPFIAGTNLDEGTLFIPPTLNSSALLSTWLVANTTPTTVPPAKYHAVIDTILELYPDILALGSPFGTGNDTFGLNSEFKRASAVQGDISFQSLRREWTQAASLQGVKVFAYLFTDPQTSSGAPQLGVSHGSEIAYVYGIAPNGPESVTLSHNMIDYWVSFANSLDPNDDHGNTTRTLWAQYTPTSESVLELNGENLTMIPDTYREKQISFLNAHPLAIRH